MFGGNEAGVGVAVVGDLHGPEAFEGRAGLTVFEVEVGGDDEEAVVGEAMEASVEHALPEVVAVPEVLVAEEGHVELLAGGEAVENLEAVAGFEAGEEAVVRVGFPSDAGLLDLGGAEVGAEDVELFGVLAEDIDEDAGLVGAAAGEVEDAASGGVGEGVAALLEALDEGLLEVAHVGADALIGEIGLLESAHLGTSIAKWANDSRLRTGGNAANTPGPSRPFPFMTPPLTPVKPLSEERLAAVRNIGDQFAIEGEFALGEEISSGHINSTYLATYAREGEERRRYILQRINANVFHDPLAVMRNVECVTHHINWKVLRVKRDAGGQTLSLYPDKTGRFYVRGPNGGIWRCYNFFEGCQTYDVVENTRQAYEAGHAFGAFQDLVSDLPPAEIVETIPDFHHTLKRHETLQAAVAEDRAGRKGSVAGELEFIRANESVLGRLLEMQASGELPVRITHNDTKINNVLFDGETDEAVCVIDLDTVMPGLSLYDFGDLVRTTTNPAAEDATSVKGVEMRMGFFEPLVEGYLKAAGDVLNEAEVAMLAFSGRLISLELGMRFLTDHLNGDQYFRVHREGQNLDRARTQLKLAERIEQKEGEMSSFVRKVARSR